MSAHGSRALARDSRCTYHSGFLHAGIQLNPMDVIRRCKLADGHMPPVSAGKAWVGMCACRRVIDKVLDCLLCEGRVSLGAGRGRGRMSLVLCETLPVGSDMSCLVAARLRAGPFTEGGRSCGCRWTRGTDSGCVVGGSFWRVHDRRFSCLNRGIAKGGRGDVMREL
jgi:hypothetical protein